MADTKSVGGRPKQVATFDEGPETVMRFMNAVKTVLSVPKERILELEKKHRKAGKRR